MRLWGFLDGKLPISLPVFHTGNRPTSALARVKKQGSGSPTVDGTRRRGMVPEYRPLVGERHDPPARSPRKEARQEGERESVP
jgi:hypothetical protein